MICRAADLIIIYHEPLTLRMNHVSCSHSPFNLVPTAVATLAVLVSTIVPLLPVTSLAIAVRWLLLLLRIAVRSIVSLLWWLSMRHFIALLMSCRVRIVIAWLEACWWLCAVARLLVSSITLSWGTCGLRWSAVIALSATCAILINATRAEHTTTTRSAA